MGMFDSVNVPCPRCGEMLEFQSKAGDCTLAEYRLDNAPPEIIGDISRDQQWCSGCQATVGIRVQTLAMPYIK